MTPISKPYASAGCTRASVRRVTLALSHTNLLPTTLQRVSTSRILAATTTSAAGPMSASTLQHRLARRLAPWDTARRAMAVLVSMRASAPRSPTRVTADMVTNVDWATFIVRLVCARPLVFHRIAYRLRAILPRRSLMTAPTPRPGLEEPPMTLISSASRLTSSLSMPKVEHTYQGRQ
jgi:hypothetical protein